MAMIFTMKTSVSTSLDDVQTVIIAQDRPGDLFTLEMVCAALASLPRRRVSNRDVTKAELTQLPASCLGTLHFPLVDPFPLHLVPPIASFVPE